MAVDWTQGYSAQWRIFRVNRTTWADEKALGDVSDIKIERQASGGMLESGAFSVDGESFTEGYYRIAMTAIQGSISERVDVATLLCSSAQGTIDRNNNTMEVVGASVLKPADESKLLSGEYVYEGTDGAAAASDLLKRSLHAPVHVQGSFTIEDTVVFDIGSSILDAVWTLLDIGGYCIQIDGRGEVYIRSLPKTPDLVLDSIHTRILQPGIDYLYEWSSVPNRYTVIDGALIGQAINDEPTSPTSIIARGRYVDELDESPTRLNGETLQAYARRRLAELSVVRDERSYIREFWPGVYPYSIVQGSIASVGIEGDLRVESQSLDCGAGITVTEKAIKELRTWI